MTSSDGYLPVPTKRRDRNVCLPILKAWIDSKSGLLIFSDSSFSSLGFRMSDYCLVTGQNFDFAGTYNDWAIAVPTKAFLCALSVKTLRLCVRYCVRYLASANKADDLHP